jgi:hypothetical protein
MDISIPSMISEWVKLLLTETDLLRASLRLCFLETCRLVSKSVLKLGFKVFADRNRHSLRLPTSARVQ